MIFGNREPHDIFEPEQWLVMKHRNGRVAEHYYSLFDTGSYYNFIVRSVVERLDLDIYVHNQDVTSELIGGIEVHTRQYVKPTWRLHEGQKKHQNFEFFIVDKLPDDLRVVVGGRTSSCMNINLRAQRSALPVFPKDGVRKGTCIPLAGSIHCSSR